jgi:hypothetical protein
MYLLQVRIDVADYDADALSQGDNLSEAPLARQPDNKGKPPDEPEH